MDRGKQFKTWYWVAAILAILVIQYLAGTARRIAPVPYRQFR